MANRRSRSGWARILPLVFVAWTLFVWGGRLRNLAQEPGPIAEASRWSLVASLTFCVLAVALVGALALERRSPGRAPIRPLLGVLGALTTVVWVIRGIDIAIGDHSLGFIVVHLVLALVSIGLAGAAWLAVRPRSLGETEGGGADRGRLPSKRWVSL